MPARFVADILFCSYFAIIACAEHTLKTDVEFVRRLTPRYELDAYGYCPSLLFADDEHRLLWREPCLRFYAR